MSWLKRWLKSIHVGKYTLAIPFKRIELIQIVWLKMLTPRITKRQKKTIWNPYIFHRKCGLRMRTTSHSDFGVAKITKNQMKSFGVHTCKEKKGIVQD